MEAHSREPIWSARFRFQRHAGLLRGAAPFALITGLATRHNILPALAATLDDRSHMIKRELLFIKSFATVLALVPVAQEDVGAREFDHVAAFSEGNVADEPYNGRDANRDSHAAYDLIGFFDDLDLSLEKELDCLLPRNDVKWLKRGVE